MSRQLNGFSNMFWGWGGEDDDMAARVQSKGDQFKISDTDQTYQKIRTYQTSKSAGMQIERYSAEIARYRMIKHQPEKRNKMRWSLLKTSSKRFL